MKHIIHKLTVFALSFGASLGLHAQEMRSSYFIESAAYRHQLNPALLDSTAYVAMPFLGQVNVGTTGNLGLKNLLYKTDGTVTPTNPNGYPYTTFLSPDVSASEFLSKLNDVNRMDAYLNWGVISVAFPWLKGNNLIEVNLRTDVHVQASKEFFGMLKEFGKQNEYDLDHLGATGQMYAEMAFGHSHRINDRLTVGAKAKLLFGMAYGDIDVDRLYIYQSGERWHVGADVNVTGNMFEMGPGLNYAATDEKGRPRIESLQHNRKWTDIGGMGMAVDLGATYKIMDNFTVSAALNDLGFIVWKDSYQGSLRNEFEFDGLPKDIHVCGEKHGNLIQDQAKEIWNDIKTDFALYYDGRHTTTRMLGATLNVGAEYKLKNYRPLSFGFLYTSRIQGRYSYHQGMLSAQWHPCRQVELGLNTSLGSTGWNLGGIASFTANRFNFYIATDRVMFGKFGKQFIPLTSSNVNVSLGMVFNMERRR